MNLQIKTQKESDIEYLLVEQISNSVLSANNVQLNDCIVQDSTQDCMGVDETEAEDGVFDLVESSELITTEIVNCAAKSVAGMLQISVDEVFNVAVKFGESIRDCLFEELSLVERTAL